jgi:hypothetical protein
MWKGRYESARGPTHPFDSLATYGSPFTGPWLCAPA